MTGYDESQPDRARAPALIRPTVTPPPFLLRHASEWLGRGLRLKGGSRVFCELCWLALFIVPFVLMASLFCLGGVGGGVEQFWRKLLSLLVPFRFVSEPLISPFLERQSPSSAVSWKMMTVREVRRGRKMAGWLAG